MKTKTPSDHSLNEDTAIATETQASSRETLETIFEDTLKDIYWAEKHLTKELAKMARAAFNEALGETFETLQNETRIHIGRIEKCFEILEMKATAIKCEAMEGLVKEGERVLKGHREGHARDAALIAAVQKIKHYEISSYGTLRTMANILGRVQCAELLEETKDEECEADEKLTELALKINQLAFEGA